MTRFTTAARRALQQTAAFALALGMTGVALLSLNHLATEQHAAVMLAKAAAEQQAKAASAAPRG